MCYIVNVCSPSISHENVFDDLGFRGGYTILRNNASLRRSTGSVTVTVDNYRVRDA